MQAVRMPKSAVIDRLEAAKAEHQAIVQEAIDGYRVKATEELTRMLKAAQEGKIVRFQWPLVLPEDHTRDFDAVLGMLRDTVEDEVLLDEEEYRTYMLNEWSWRRNFLVTNSPYSAIANSRIDS